MTVLLGCAEMINSDFGLIGEVNVNDEGSWRGRPFLTFDIDWAHDQIVEDTINLVESFGVSATWFVTHKSRQIDRLRTNSLFQLGLHPNFNPLLDGGQKSHGNAAEILASLCEIVPDAKVLRSHSLTQSERLVDLFLAHGVTHMSNTFIPISQNNHITPWCLWGSLTVVPHCWQDNVSLKMELPFPGKIESLRHLVVYDFHPIQVFLNTEHLDRYEGTRHLHQRPDELIKHRFEGSGARTRLLELLAREKTRVGLPRCP